MPDAAPVMNAVFPTRSFISSLFVNAAVSRLVRRPIDRPGRRLETPPPPASPLRHAAVDLGPAPRRRARSADHRQTIGSSPYLAGAGRRLVSTSGATPR